MPASRTRWLSITAASLFAALSLAACTDSHRIDASSPDRMKASIAVLKSSLSPAETERFEKAMLSLTVGQMMDGDTPFATLAAYASDPGEPNRVVSLFQDRLNGKTAAEVIAEGEGLIAKRTGRQAEALDKRIAEATRTLETMKRDAASGAKVPGLFAVDRVRYAYEGDFIAEPNLRFRIRNGSTVAVRKIYAQAIVESPGRSIPWIDETFNYEFPGGLESREVRELSLTPNRFSGQWGDASLQERRDLLATVRILRIEDAGGKVWPKVTDEEVAKASADLEDLIASRAKLRAGR